MYFLQSSPAPDRSAEFKDFLCGFRDPQSEAERVHFFESALLRDPHFALRPRIGFRATELIKELFGQKTVRPYGHAIYRRSNGAKDDFDVARAMVLADQSSGLLDSICLNIFEQSFGAYSPGAHAEFRFERDKERLDWPHLKEIIGAAALRSGDQLRTDGLGSGVDHFELTLVNRSVGSAQLALTVDRDRGTVGWTRAGSILRGSSARSVLIDNLNSAVEDFSNRLELRESYLNASPKAGLTAEQLQSLRVALVRIHGGSFDLRPLSPGVTLGEDPLILERNEIYASLLRCLRCGQVTSAVVNREPRSAGWENEKASHRLTKRAVDSERAINEKLWEFHRANGCSFKP